MTSDALIAELKSRAAARVEDAPAWALDEAVREIVSIIATARGGSARAVELGEFDPIVLDDQARKAAEMASDFTRWPRYRARAALRKDGAAQVR
ncbi:MAG TPA: hypothetical protein VNF29_10890 [Candidatus Binataceae bacterium]|nr:hypothetical protein [Candidatus Binataceae bacterium]